MPSVWRSAGMGCTHTPADCLGNLRGFNYVLCISAVLTLVMAASSWLSFDLHDDMLAPLRTKLPMVCLLYVFRLLELGARITTLPLFAVCPRLLREAACMSVICAIPELLDMLSLPA